MGESVKLKKEEQKTNMKNIHGNEKKTGYLQRNNNDTGIKTSHKQY